ncbi:MAG: hypothetical protein JO005_04685, partial [Gammaproteobacteria bacterium]|nr:hypothetical protein [Gammaproteobacteria bacterium]
MGTMRAERWIGFLGCGCLAACGGGGGGGSTPPPPMGAYSVGGHIYGLSGSGLVLSDNGGAGLAVTASGSFSFPTLLNTGMAFAVTVATQPSAPGQQCTVLNGTGTVANANITDVEVDCAPPQFVALANQPPTSGYLALLLTDGTVMMQSNADAGVFYALSPDATGGYLQGTWRRLASPPVGYAPYAGAQAVLADGRVLFVGGEYNQNQYSLPFAP